RRGVFVDEFGENLHALARRRSCQPQGVGVVFGHAITVTHHPFGWALRPKKAMSLLRRMDDARSMRVLAPTIEDRAMEPGEGDLTWLVIERLRTKDQESSKSSTRPTRSSS